MARPKHRVLRNRRRHEGSRSNLLLRSDNLAAWVNNRAVDEANQGTEPLFGFNNAWKVTDDALTGTNSANMYQILTVAVNTQYTYSAYYKTDQSTWVNHSVTNLDGLSLYSYFDLVAGVAGTKGAQTDTATITEEGDGWYRCSITFSTTTDTSCAIIIALAEGDGDQIVTRDGSNSILWYGAQLSKDDRPIDYIPTQATAVIG